MEDTTGVLDTTIEKQWSTLSKAQKVTTDFLKDSVHRPLEEGNLVTFFNKKLVSHSFTHHTSMLTRNIIGYKQIFHF